jgi:ankyrin repeat protein
MGAKRLTPGEDGWTDLMSAALEGDIAKVQDLLAKGADVNAQNRFGGTALMLAASQGDTAIVEALLAKGADVNAKSNEGWTALTDAILAGQVAIAQILLDRGVDPNAKSLFGSQVLQTAAERGQETIVRALLDKGADVNAKDKSGNTALTAAVGNGHEVVVRALLAKGADVRVNPTALFATLERGHTGVAQALLDKGADFNARDGRSATPLIVAARKGQAALVQTLLDRGADLHAKDISGHTPFLAAASGGHTAIVQSLLAKGMDVNSKVDFSGVTALMLAAERGASDTVRALLDHGADNTAKDVEGWSAVVYADMNGHTEMVKTLLAYESARKSPDATKPVSLLYVQQENDKCDLKKWNPLTKASNLLTSFQKCPDDVFLAEEANTVIVVTGDTMQEIVFRPDVIAKPSIQLPFRKSKVIVAPEKQLTLVGYLKDGRPAVLGRSWRPADESDLYLYAFENNQWVLVEQKFCDRFEACTLGPVNSRSWRQWKEESQVWHPRLALNPFVVARGVARQKGTTFLLDEGTANLHEGGGWKYLRLAVKGRQSILYYHLQGGDESSGPYTFAIYLQTSQDVTPVSLNEGQCETAIEQKYLLLNSYSRDGLHLIDLETGKEPIKGLKLAFWVR